jgi:hypothetical protein
VHQRRKRIVSPQKAVKHHLPGQDWLSPQTFDPGYLPDHAVIDRTGRHGFETEFVPVGHQRDIDPGERRHFFLPVGTPDRRVVRSSFSSVATVQKAVLPVPGGELQASAP